MSLQILPWLGRSDSRPAHLLQHRRTHQEDRDRKPRVPNPSDRWDYDEIVKNEPSGLLALIIHCDRWETSGAPNEMAGQNPEDLKNLIPDFVAGLMRIAVVLRQNQEERERKKLEEQQRAQEMAQLRKDIEEEEKKLKQFHTWLEDWERARANATLHSHI
jgi:hypothetical protein